MTRMSDVFELPVGVETHGGRLYYDARSNPAYFSHIKQAESAAIAINQHDTIIRLLQYAYEHLLIDMSDPERAQWFIDVLEVLEGEL